MENQLTVRAATEKDIHFICSLLKIYAEKQIVLARDEEDIRFYLGNFAVCELNGELKGCIAVRNFGDTLREIRSLAVMPDCKGMGIGRAMLEFVMNKIIESKEFVRLFALTYQDGFFLKLGFHRVDKERFPEKIWSDCAKCPKKDHCDEIAVMHELNLNKKIDCRIAD